MWKALLPYRQQRRRTVANALDCVNRNRSKTDVDVVNPAIPGLCNRILGFQSSSLSSAPYQHGATTTKARNPLNGVFHMRTEIVMVAPASTRTIQRSHGIACGSVRRALVLMSEQAVYAPMAF